MSNAPKPLGTEPDAERQVSPICRKGDIVYAPYVVAGRKYWVHAIVSYFQHDDVNVIYLYPFLLAKNQKYAQFLIRSAAGDLSRERPTDGAPIIDTVQGLASLQIRNLIQKNSANTRDLLTPGGREELDTTLAMLECGPLPTREEVLQQFSAQPVDQQERPLCDFTDSNVQQYLFEDLGWMQARFLSLDTTGKLLCYDVPALERERRVPIQCVVNKVSLVRFDLPPGIRSIDMPAKLHALHDLDSAEYRDLYGDLPAVVEQRLIAMALGISPVKQAGAGATRGTIDGRDGTGDVQ